MSEMSDVHVCSKGSRRCRCGRCFDTLGSDVSVDAADLARLKADPMLVVTEPAAATAAETDKSAAKASKAG